MSVITDQEYQVMHAIYNAIHSNKRCTLGVRLSRRLCAFLFVVTVFLGTASAVFAATATWQANPETDIAGYILSYGTQPGVHPTSIDTGNVTTWQINALTPGQTYYFVL